MDILKILKKSSDKGIKEALKEELKAISERMDYWRIKRHLMSELRDIAIFSRSAEIISQEEYKYIEKFLWRIFEETKSEFSKLENEYVKLRL